jgi:hypothetical protein
MIQPKHICALLISLFQVFGIKAQIDVKQSTIINLGFGSRNITHSGILYYVPASVGYNDWNSSPLRTAPDFHCKGIATDINVTQFGEKGMIKYGLDGLVYLLSLFPYTKPEHEGKLNNIIGVNTTEFDSNEFPYLTEEQRKFWNWKLVDFSYVGGKHDFGCGVHISLQEIGYTPFTYYTSLNGSRTVLQPGGSVVKMFIGPTVGYRKSLGMVSLCVIGGVNTTPNQARFVHVQYAPFIQPTIYFGKRAGLSVSAFYQEIHGKPFTETGQRFDKLDYKEFKLCVGLYLTSKSEI